MAFGVGPLRRARIPMSADERYSFFKGRKRGDPDFGDLDEVAYDPADMEHFEKMKMDVKASGEHLQLDKQKRMGIMPESFEPRRDI